MKHYVETSEAVLFNFMLSKCEYAYGWILKSIKTKKSSSSSKSNAVSKSKTEHQENAKLS